jgi:hypothetical protein
VHDLKEKSAPQEYAFLFISIIDVLLFVTIMGLVNIVVGHNLLNGGIVIITCSLIAIVNYLIFLREKKYTHQLERFKELSSPEFKRKRVRTTVVTPFAAESPASGTPRISLLHAFSNNCLYR